MKIEVSTAIEELKLQFAPSNVIVREDAQGGAFVTIESVGIGPKYIPAETWLGFQITAQYPYADIYPVFMEANVVRADGGVFNAPVTRGHTFEGRPAIQISRRNSVAQNGQQKAASKILRVIDFLEKYQ
jgi:hypothetical protein